MIAYEGSYDDICKSHDLGQVIFPGWRNYTIALTLCQDVRGNMLQIETEAQQIKALELMKNSTVCSNKPNKIYGSEGAWIAWWDNDSEGEWVSAINSSKFLEKNSFQRWAPGEPNGERIENCAVLRSSGEKPNYTKAFRFSTLFSFDFFRGLE